MSTNRTKRKLALAAGDDLGPWASRRLQRQLAEKPELHKELAELQGVRKTFGKLEHMDLSDIFDDAARARLRMRVRARVRAEASAAPARGWLPVLSGATAAAALVAVGLALVLGTGPVPQATPPTSPVVAENVKVFVTHGSEGMVFSWTNGEPDGAQYVVLRRAGSGDEEVVAKLKGHRWVAGHVAANGLETYRVVRLAERKNSKTSGSADWRGADRVVG